MRIINSCENTVANLIEKNDCDKLSKNGGAAGSSFRPGHAFDACVPQRLRLCLQAFRTTLVCQGLAMMPVKTGLGFLQDLGFFSAGGFAKPGFVWGGAQDGAERFEAGWPRV
ncbi:MAG: hypothetical protein AAGC92_15370 [Pseudomonadota bacterium]